MVQVKGLQHIGILVPDVEKAVEWYVEKSGFMKKMQIFRKLQSKWWQTRQGLFPSISTPGHWKNIS